MRLEDLSIESTRVRLWGERGAVEVTCPAPGVMRVRHAPSSLDSTFSHPALPPKHSWAVVSNGELPVTARRDGGSVTVSAEGAVLEIRLDSSAWEFREPGGRVLAACASVSGEPKPDYPVNRYRSRFALHAPPGEGYLGFG